MIHDLKIRLKILLIVFFGIMFLGTIGFMFIENKSVIDAAYYVVVTIATVGYGDIHPVTQVGKIFAIALIVSGVGTFLGVIANFTEIMLARREIQIRMEKLNMVIGVFFSEVGLNILSIFTRCDAQCDMIRPELVVTAAWKEKDFRRAKKDLSQYNYTIDIGNIDIDGLKSFFMSKRDFLVGLLENPVLLEHQSFTDLLRAVFHLAEELAYREDLKNILQTDKDHLSTDAKRAYTYLVSEWLDYLKYLKNNYPFLFSLAMRINPLDPESSVVVK